MISDTSASDLWRLEVPQRKKGQIHKKRWCAVSSSPFSLSFSVEIPPIYVLLPPPSLFRGLLLDHRLSSGDSRALFTTHHFKKAVSDPVIPSISFGARLCGNQYMIKASS